MVVKILKSPGDSSASLRYNESKVACGDAEVIHLGNIITEGTRISTIRNIEEDPGIESHVRKKGFHMAVNPGEGEEMDDATARRYVDEFMERLGYGKQPYIVYKHHDIDRVHYHVVSTRIEKKTLTTIFTSFEHRRVNEIMKELAPKYGYYPGRRPGARMNVYNGAFNLKKGNTIAQIENLIEFVAKNYVYTSPEEFADIMKVHNVEVKELTFGKSRRMGFRGLRMGESCTRLIDDIDRSGEIYRQIEENARRNAELYDRRQLLMQQLRMAETLEEKYEKARSRQHFEALLKKEEILLVEYEEKVRGRRGTQTKLGVIDASTGLYHTLDSLTTAFTMEHYRSLPEEERQNRTRGIKH